MTIIIDLVYNIIEGEDCQYPFITSKETKLVLFHAIVQAAARRVWGDPQGKPVGPFLTKPDKRYGDMTIELSKTVFEDYAKSGKGPVYMDCGGISDEDYEYMIYWLKQEGNTALLNHLKEEGIETKKGEIKIKVRTTEDLLCRIKKV